MKNWLTRTFAAPAKIEPEVIPPRDTLEIPGYDPDLRSGLYINPLDVVAIGMKAPAQSSLLFAGDPQDECTLTLLVKNSNEIKINLNAERAMRFAKKVYDYAPDNFVEATPDNEFLRVDTNVRYLFAKGQIITGTLKTNDFLDPWGVNLSFSSPGTILVKLHNCVYGQNTTHKVTKLANELAEFSESVIISMMGGTYKGKPAKKPSALSRLTAER